MRKKDEKRWGEMGGDEENKREEMGRDGKYVLYYYFKYLNFIAHVCMPPFKQKHSPETHQEMLKDIQEGKLTAKEIQIKYGYKSLAGAKYWIAMVRNPESLKKKKKGAGEEKGGDDTNKCKKGVETEKETVENNESMIDMVNPNRQDIEEFKKAIFPSLSAQVLAEPVEVVELVQACSAFEHQRFSKIIVNRKKH